MKKPDIDRNRPLGLYLHIPFCKAKCAYCDFYSLAHSEEKMDAYAAALTHAVQTGGIAEVLLHGRQHGIQRRLAHLCGGRVICAAAAHTTTGITRILARQCSVSPNTPPTL